VSSLLIVIVSAAVACGLTTVLASMLLLAERYLVSYGTCAIDVNSGSRRLEVPGGQSLLMALKDEGVFLASACGGRGTCAYCKCGIVEGGGPVGPTEQPLLTEEEIAAGVRISCQVKVRNDMRIAVPEELLAVREFRGAVERIRDLTHDIKELRIRLIEPETIDFVAGQYVQLEAPPYAGSREAVFRAYSISSPPHEKDGIELIIRLVPGGICTTWVFEHLREGDEVTLTGPFGDFRLSETDREMVWVAGGSGMAPFWSMIRHMKHADITRRCRYFFGAVRKRDMFFVDELTEMAKEMPSFEFVPALSDVGAGEQWSGERGLITEVVDRHVDGADGREGYLCGSPGMCDAAIKVLTGKGFPEDRIFFDKFA
jgi:Na+-transporting NADH:ubiquinone oxidoreductase subunit F